MGMFNDNVSPKRLEWEYLSSMDMKYKPPGQ